MRAYTATIARHVSRDLREPEALDVRVELAPGSAEQLSRLGLVLAGLLSAPSMSPPLTSQGGSRLTSRPSPTRDLQVRLEDSHWCAMQTSSWSAQQSTVRRCPTRLWPCRSCTLSLPLLMT